MKQVVKRVSSARYTRLVLGLLISGACLYFALRNANLKLVVDELKEVKPLFLVAALLVVLLNNFSKALRWQNLLGEKGEDIRLGALFVSHMSGQTLNVVFPARLGDLSRAYLVGGMGPGRVFVLFTVLLEKLPDLVAFATLFVLTLLLIPLPELIGEYGYSLVAITAIASVIVLYVMLQRQWVVKFLMRLLRWLPQDIRLQAEEQLASGLSSLDVLRKRSSFFPLVFLTVLIWASGMFVNHLVLLAFDLHLPWTASLLLLVALQVGILIPSVPGKIGVFEYICIQSLAVYGIGQTAALSYGILLHAVVFLPIVLLGLPFISFLGARSTHLKELR